jgi:hypothetical protein
MLQVGLGVTTLHFAALNANIAQMFVFAASDLIWGPYGGAAIFNPVFQFNRERGQ